MLGLTKGDERISNNATTFLNIIFKLDDFKQVHEKFKSRKENSIQEKKINRIYNILSLL